MIVRIRWQETLSAHNRQVETCLQGLCVTVSWLRADQSLAVPVPLAEFFPMSNQSPRGRSTRP